MIKTIPVSQLRVGMYVHDLNCSWIEHGFLRSRFPIRTDAELQRIRQTGSREIQIDTSKGADVAETAAAPAPAVIATAASPRRDAPVAIMDEFMQARRIHAEAVNVLGGLMEDARLGRSIALERTQPVVGTLVDSIFRNPNALLGMTRIRNTDRYTFEHSVNVSVLMVSFGRALGLEPTLIHDLGLGALLHDIGKILVPPRILNKPDRLTEDEFRVMRGHVVYTGEILAKIPGVPPAALAVAVNHHERVDGSGYPQGKSGADISRYGQMAAIVDVYDALTADRVYHKGVDPHTALRRLLAWSQGDSQHFDHALVQRFIRCVGIYPVGTLVRLRGGRLGVVVESSREGMIQPVVRVFMDIRRRRHLAMQDVDLSRQKKSENDAIESVESPERWQVDPADILLMRSR